MPILAPAQAEFPKCPEGLHRAVCVSVIDLGTQTGGQFGPSRKVAFTFETPDEKMENGRSFTLTEMFTLSLNEKSNLYKKLNSWRGKTMGAEEAKRFDLGQMLGKPCMIQVVHNEAAGGGGKVYANIGSIVPLPKGMAPPAHTVELKQFSIEETVLPGDLPKFLATKIVGSQEWRARSGANGGTTADPGFDEFSGPATPAAPPGPDAHAGDDDGVPF